MKIKHGLSVLGLLVGILCLCLVPAAAALTSDTTGTVADESTSTATKTQIIATTDPTRKVYESVQVDDFTGEVIAGENASIVKITSDCSYDKSTEMFVFESGNSAGTTFRSSVPNGAIVQETVQLEVPDTLTPVLYCNGNEVDASSMGSITSPGAYTLSITQDGDTVKVLSFTVLGEYVGQTYSFTLPDTFRIVEATCANQLIVYSENEVPLEEEGQYSITYTNDAASVRYKVNFTVDHTPPELTFAGVEDGVAKGAVTISGAQEGDTVSILIDGNQAAYSDTLAVAGDYSVTVTDRAGNSNTYTFTIRTHFNSFTWLLLLLVAALSAAGIVYVLYQRKKFRSN